MGGGDLAAVVDRARCRDLDGGAVTALGGTRPPALTDGQKREVVRQKTAHIAYKVIARTVGCTIAQAIRCWACSKPAQAARRRRIERNSKQRTRGAARRLAQRQAEAQAELASQIEAAKREAASGKVPLYRGGWPC